MLLALANFRVRTWLGGNALLIATVCAVAIQSWLILYHVMGISLSVMSVVLSATCFFGMPC